MKRRIAVDSKVGRPGGVFRMIVGVPKEIKSDEYRVAMLPVGAEELSLAGHTVLIEAGAGQGSGIVDAQYQAAGAKIIPEAAQIWARIGVGDQGQGAATVRVAVDEARPGGVYLLSLRRRSGADPGSHR